MHVLTSPRPRYCYLLVLLGMCGALQAGEQPNWQVVIDTDPVSGTSGCLMISAEQHTDDGQTRTPVDLVYNGQDFIARTRSNIDPSYDNLGLQVDGHERHAIERVYRKHNVIFTERADRIRDQFISGLNGRLTLGFWPTWPKTRSYTVEFDLRGFTRAYQAFKRCRDNGELPAQDTAFSTGHDNGTQN